MPHTIEEAYEVADAALAADDAKLEDELGDLLFQTYFLALLLQERNGGSLESIARGIHEKLVRRHPHVFGGAEVATPARVRKTWDRVKREEDGREGLFHHVPETLPALLYARKLQRRAAAIDFDYPDAAGALADLDEELAELREALRTAGEPPPESQSDPRVFEELGDVQILPYPDDVVSAARDAAFELYDELSGSDENFATLFESWNPYRAGAARWFGLAEASIINFAAQESPE